MPAIEETFEVTSTAFGVHEYQFHVRVLLGDGLQRARVRHVGIGVRVMHEHDLARVLLLHQRPKHRHDRGDSTAATDQQHPTRAVDGKGEHTVCLREADNESGCRVGVQILRHQATRMRFHGELDQPTARRRTPGRRVAASVTNTVDHHAQLHELARLKTAPLASRAQRESDGVSRRMVDGDNLRADVTNRRHRVDQLEVPIDLMWSSHGFDQSHQGQSAPRCGLRCRVLRSRCDCHDPPRTSIAGCIDCWASFPRLREFSVQMFTEDSVTGAHKYMSTRM